MDAAGNYVVTWHGGGYFDKNSSLRAQRFAAGGGPLGINFDVAAHPSEAVALNSCDVAMDGDGDFAVIWATTWRDSSSGIFGIGNGRVDQHRYAGPCATRRATAARRAALAPSACRAWARTPAVPTPITTSPNEPP